jgi:integrase
MSVGKIIRRAWSRRGPTGRKVRVVSYGFTVQLDGKQVKRFNAGWDEETARHELAKFQIDREKPKAKPVTFGDAAERYETAKARKRSLAEDKRTLKRLLAHFGRETKLDRLSAATISQYRDQRLAAGSKTRKDKEGNARPLSAAAINRELALLRHLLRLAHEEWGALTTLPKIRLEKEPQGRLRWLTPEEANTLLSKCREQKKDLADLVEFCLLTGLRQSEALGLTWERCDRSRGVIRIEETKSGRRREVPLVDESDAVLVRRGPQASGLVFGSSSWPSFRAYWEEAVKTADLVDFHFHDLRHTFASWAIQRGATLPELKDLLGHSSLAMVMRYAHLSPEHLRSAVGRLSGMLTTAGVAVVSELSAQNQPIDAAAGHLVYSNSAESHRNAGVAQRQSN